MLFSPLCSGSSGNASYLEAGGVRLLIDAGVTAKRLRELMTMIDLAPDGLDAILVTHEHSDHVSGIGVLSRKYDIPVYAAAECWENMPRSVGEIATKNIRVFEPDRDFYLKQLLRGSVKSLHPVVRDILHLGLYQLYELDKIPDSAAVNESVALAKKYSKNPKAVSLVNGVLRNAVRDRGQLKEPTSYADKYSHPDALISLLKQNLPKGTL